MISFSSTYKSSYSVLVSIVLHLLAISFLSSKKTLYFEIQTFSINFRQYVFLFIENKIFSHTIYPYHSFPSLQSSQVPTIPLPSLIHSCILSLSLLLFSLALSGWKAIFRSTKMFTTSFCNLLLMLNSNCPTQPMSTVYPSVLCSNKHSLHHKYKHA